MSEMLKKVVEETSRIVVGKDRQVRLCVSCLLAHGHLLAFGALFFFGKRTVKLVTPAYEAVSL